MSARPPLRTTLRPGEKIMRPVRPNAGLRVEYRERMMRLIDQMHADVMHQIPRAYAASPPATVMAEDATPIQLLNRVVRDLSRKWLSRFNAMSVELAEWFAQAVQDRSDTAMRRILRDGGVTVRFQASKAVRDAMAAGVGENVSLIKTIHSQYFGQIEQLVMRSAMKGGDLHQLTRDLQRRYGVTANRAALIARDQNAKMTAIVVKERQREIGVKEAIWLHSHGGNEPRPSHLAFDGHRYEIEKGAWLEDVGGRFDWVWPGTAINCRCVSKSIIPGVNDAGR